MNKKIFCTLGPATLNQKFLSYSQKNIDLLRINMSHINLKNLENTIRYIRKYTTTPICLDTEGAQIRTKIKKKIFLKKNKTLKINFKNGNSLFYPEYVNEKLKKNDVLELGFSGLEVKIVKKNSQDLVLKVIKNGLLETNKGVHVKNRKIKMNYLTDKDMKAIKIAKIYKIKNFALSFANSASDIKKFNLLLKKERKIFKLETKQALKEIKEIVKVGDNFLIDRGDLSKDIKIENIPIAQRKIIQKCKKAKKKVYVATNFLESMINESSPTRGEVNDVYSTLEQGANGLVLAAETAIGKYPIECVEVLKKLIKTFNKKL